MTVLDPVKLTITNYPEGQSETFQVENNPNDAEAGTREISFSLPVLMFLYPLSITLILLSLLGGLFGRDRRVFVSVTVLTLAAAVLDFLAALPEGAKSILHLEGLLGWANSYIPLFSYGLGWLLPAALGLTIGLALRWRASR